MFPAFAPPIPATRLPTQAEAIAHTSSQISTVKRLIWVYFWLLIFEGALRKWLLPGWSNPLLLVRDPVVIMIYAFALGAGVFPRNTFIGVIIGLGLASVLLSELVGRGNLLVTLYGFRTSFLHLPLVFVIPEVFSKQDMDKMGRWLLLTSIPMCLLVLAQFRAAPNDWINRGVGGNEGGQFWISSEKIRPPGTFSFTSVLVCYLGVVAAFVLHSQVEKKAANAKVASAALPALAAMVGVSCSRSVLGAVSLVLFCTAFICWKIPAFFARGVKLLIFVGVAFLGLNLWSEFRLGLEIHQARIEGSGGIKIGMVDRVGSSLIDPFYAAIDAPFLGTGLGMGTNAASGILYGRPGFSLGEGDWERTVRESGPILGFAYIGLRIAILIHLARRALASLDRHHPLPLLLLSATFPHFLNGQFAVPSILGFAVFSAGLCLASNEDSLEPGPLTASPATPLAPALAAPSLRGRSVYANDLHGELEDPHVSRYGP